MCYIWSHWSTIQGAMLALDGVLTLSAAHTAWQVQKLVRMHITRCPTTAAKTEISSTAASPVPPFVQLIPPFIKSCHQVIEQSLWVCILVKISAYLASLSHIHATWSTTSLSHIKHAESHNHIATLLQIQIIAAKASYLYYLVTWAVLGITAWWQDYWSTAQTNSWIKTDRRHLAVSVLSSVIWTSTAAYTIHVVNPSETATWFEGELCEQAVLGVWKIVLLVLYCSLSKHLKGLLGTIGGKEVGKYLTRDPGRPPDIPIIQLSTHDDWGSITDHKASAKKKRKQAQRSVSDCGYRPHQILADSAAAVARDADRTKAYQYEDCTDDGEVVTGEGYGGMRFQRRMSKSFTHLTADVEEIQRLSRGGLHARSCGGSSGHGSISRSKSSRQNSKTMGELHRKLEQEIDFASNSFSNVNNVVYNFGGGGGARSVGEAEVGPNQPFDPSLSDQEDCSKASTTSHKKALLEKKLRKIFLTRKHTHPERRLSEVFMDVINLTAVGLNNSGLTTSGSSGNKKPAARKVSAPSRQRRCSLQGCLLNASADFELVKPIQRQPSIVSPKLPTAIARLSQDKEIDEQLTHDVVVHSPRIISVTASTNCTASSSGRHHQMASSSNHHQPRQSSVDFDEYGSEICRIKIIADDQQSNHVDSSGAEEQEAFILKGHRPAVWLNSADEYGSRQHPISHNSYPGNTNNPTHRGVKTAFLTCLQTSLRTALIISICESLASAVVMATTKNFLPSDQTTTHQLGQQKSTTQDTNISGLCASSTILGLLLFLK